MAAGIVSYGAYIPMYRLSSATLSGVWGGRVTGAEKAVANWDEDSLTMATEAIIDCLNAGAAERFVIAAADCRVPAPDSEFEQLLGDGSAALLLGDSELAVEIEGNYSTCSDFIDIWKREEDTYIQAWEDRFIIEHGYLEHLREVISELFKRYNVAPKDFTKAVFYAHDARRHTELYRSLGFSPEQVQDPLLSTVGNTGTASALMMLVAALEESKAGDRILLANYGDGAEAFILRVTDRIEKLRNRRGIKKNLAWKMMLPNYGKYLHFRNLIEGQVRREPSKYASLTMSWRDRDWIMSGKGYKCKRCGGIQFPPQRVCSWCQAKDDFDEIKLVDKKGILFTFSLDNLSVSVDPPTAIAIVDVDGGGRFSTILTDRDPEKLVPDMPVEFTFRRSHEGQGIHNYFWKCRPIRA